MQEESTTIKVRKVTRDRICKLGNMNDSFDEVLNKLVDNYEKTHNV